MTEQQIIETIQEIGDEKELNDQLRMIHQMQDYLHQLQDGEQPVTAEWFNSSPALFPEDFTDEMNELSSERATSNELLKQLERIEAALIKRGEELA